MAACAGDALVPMGQGCALSSSFGPVGFILVAMVCVVLATLLFLLLGVVMNMVVPVKNTTEDAMELVSLQPAAEEEDDGYTHL